MQQEYERYEAEDFEVWQLVVHSTRRAIAKVGKCDLFGRTKND